MTDDTKPIEFTRNGERRIVCLCQQDPDGKWTAPVMATPADLAAAIKAMPSTQRTLLLIDVVEDSSALGQVRAQLAEANARIAELEHEAETAYLKQRSAELGLTLFQQSAAVTEERLAVANARIAELEAERAPLLMLEKATRDTGRQRRATVENEALDALDALRAKPSPAGEKELHPWRSGDCVAHLTSGCSCRPCLLSRGVQEPAGEKDPPELCPVVGCGCDGCTYCHDNHDEQTRCSCQCEYYRSPPAPVEQPKPPVEAPLTSDDIELTTVFAVLSYWRDATALATASHDVWSQARRYLAAAGALLGDDLTREGYVALCDCALDLCAMGKLGPATLAPILGSEISRIDRRIDELERIAKGGAK